ncbi:MAG: hypothetical protein WDN04_07060 [Rhodospirillales bacterium]
MVDQSDSMLVGDRTKLAATAADAVRTQVSKMRDLELRQIVVPEHGSAGTQLWAEVRRALADIRPIGWPGSLRLPMPGARPARRPGRSARCTR